MTPTPPDTQFPAQFALCSHYLTTYAVRREGERQRQVREREVIERNKARKVWGRRSERGAFHKYGARRTDQTREDVLNFEHPCAIVEFLKQMPGRRASKCSAVTPFRPTKARDLFPVPLER